MFIFQTDINLWYGDGGARGRVQVYFSLIRFLFVVSFRRKRCVCYACGRDDFSDFFFSLAVK